MTAGPSRYGRPCLGGDCGSFPLRAAVPGWRLRVQAPRSWLGHVPGITSPRLALLAGKQLECKCFWRLCLWALQFTATGSGGGRQIPTFAKPIENLRCSGPIFAECNRITSRNLEADFFEALDQHTPRFIQLFKSKKGSVGQKLQSINWPTPDVTEQRSVVLKGIPIVLGDDSKDFFKTCFDTTRDEALSSVTVGVLTVLSEDSPQEGPSSMQLEPISTDIVLEGVHLLKARCSLAVQMKIKELYRQRFPTKMFSPVGLALPGVHSASSLPAGLAQLGFDSHGSPSPRLLVSLLGPKHELNLPHLPSALHPVHPDVKLQRLPFYDVLDELIKPTSLEEEPGQAAVLKVTENEPGATAKLPAKNWVSFVSDGASVMLGKNSGVATRLTARYPNLFTWHCMNHHLELAVSDAVDEVQAVNHFKVFLEKIHNLYSQSNKNSRSFWKQHKKWARKS
ncbi:hypothetical protein JOQ06_023242 [Pogonophryne albipinna]|uniref:Uncharacterized protein n=1 Tax=Pogonophryne albipinna TaxID=1090488 RepID=A0AAD6BL02_9TELE|nr:hypothetical protein JOQ06_023242 [Pogonophryne albipinna]